MAIWKFVSKLTLHIIISDLPVAVEYVVQCPRSLERAVTALMHTLVS